MKPEKILQSDVLDIIFENRNKDYGAYELRKHYNNRIGKAMGITILIVVTFGLMQSFKVPKKIVKIETEEIFLAADIPTIKKDEPKPREEVKVKAIKQPPIESVQLTPPRIVPTVEPIKSMATINDLEDKKIDTKDGVGQKIPVGIVTPPSSPGGGTGDGLDKPDGNGTEEVSAAPLKIAEFMPQFPGGHDAFIKFMQRNLRQPDDFEDGQKMTITARFVVNVEGEIVDIDITQNGRKDLDAEVIRVIKKMPRWTPGMQNGRKVSVYYKVPVTFVAPE